MTAAITRKQAENAGYTVDSTTYPWFGYMGPRFAPTRTVEVMTEREEELLTQLAAALAAKNTVSLSGSAPRLYGGHTTLGPFGLLVHYDSELPHDEMEFRDHVTGRVLARIVNVGRA